MKKYSVGIDYGTLSARALLLDLDTGESVAEEVYEYPHGVLTHALPCGTPLGDRDAYQVPADYREAISKTVPTVLAKSGVCKEDVVGIGIDFTSCTVLPVDAALTPLCEKEEFSRIPHAYAKLWKHHGAEKEAEEMTRLAKERGEKWLKRYGGKVSSEWLIPKILETCRQAKNVFDAAEYFVEGGEWIAWLLTGKIAHSACMMGYKGTWSAKEGYPSSALLSALHPALENIAATKLRGEVLPAGSFFGALSEEGARLCGLSVGCAVSTPVIDAHAALPAAGVVTAERMLVVVGTSGAHIVLGKEEKDVPGICGTVPDGVVPGLVAYEAGQGCVGDMFDWFMKNCVPAPYAEEAGRRGVGIFALMEEKAASLPVGEGTVLALDWFNGNRTPYADASLTGALLGVTLATRPEEIYRALLEANAYGTRRITELYEAHGVPVREVIATGGIATKNALLMQLYADVLQKPILVPHIGQSGAMGSAICAAVAGGAFPTLESATRALLHHETKVYTPNAALAEGYNRRYRAYVTLSRRLAEEDSTLRQLREL